MPTFYIHDDCHVNGLRGKKVLLCDPLINISLNGLFGIKRFLSDIYSDCSHATSLCKCTKRSSSHWDICFHVIRITPAAVTVIKHRLHFLFCTVRVIKGDSTVHCPEKYRLVASFVYHLLSKMLSQRSSCGLDFSTERSS